MKLPLTNDALMRRYSKGQIAQTLKNVVEYNASHMYANKPCLYNDERREVLYAVIIAA
jgi:hypothetical protein